MSGSASGMKVAKKLAKIENNTHKGIADSTKVKAKTIEPKDPSSNQEKNGL